LLVIDKRTGQSGVRVGASAHRPRGTVVVVGFREIPVLSMTDWSGVDADRAAFGERLRAICHEVGFFGSVALGDVRVRG
jgi:hypothetical protein